MQKVLFLLVNWTFSVSSLCIAILLKQAAINEVMMISPWAGKNEGSSPLTPLSDSCEIY